MATGIKDPDQVDRSSTPTLSAFVMRSTGDQELAILMHNIALCCKSITRAVRKAGERGEATQMAARQQAKPGRVVCFFVFDRSV